MIAQKTADLILTSENFHLNKIHSYHKGEKKNEKLEETGKVSRKLK